MHRVIALLFIMAFSVSSFAEEISGMYLRENGISYVQTSERKKKYLLITVTDESTQAVSQLHSADLIFGTGEINGDTFFLTTVDVVGLRQLLGTWKSLYTQLHFLDFKYVTIRQQWMQVPQQPIRRTLHYVVTPGPEKTQWRVFFSDDQSVTLASLELQGRRAQFDFYDENTGEVIDRIILKKQ